MVVPEPAPGSRRRFLGGGLAAAAGVVLSGCSGQKALRIKVRSDAKVARTDVQPLNALLDIEHYAIAAYAAGIPLLHKPQYDAGVQFLAQELAHTVQLSDLIRRAGGKPSRPRASYDLGDPRDSEDVLALLKRLERAQLRAYLDAIPRLSGGKLRAAVASIFANEAQHLAMLRWQTGEAPAPAALVTGS